MNLGEENPWPKPRPVTKRKQTGWEGWLVGEVHGQAIVNNAKNGDDRCSGNRWVSNKEFSEFILSFTDLNQHLPARPLASPIVLTTTPNFLLH